MIIKFNFLEKYKLFKSFQYNYLYQLSYSLDDKLGKNYGIIIGNYCDDNIYISLARDYNSIFECAVLKIENSEVKINMDQKERINYLYHLYIESYLFNLEKFYN